MSSEKGKFGMIGLGVMGQNLALNIERNGFPVTVWNREREWVDEFIQKKGQGKQLIGTKTIEAFVNALERPRRIMMMVKAGPPVDWTIDLVKPHLDSGDIIIDGGNSYFPDTIRREDALAKDGLRFFGVGVSGGETGALWGPSMMPGGDKAAYEELKPVFEKMAAQIDDGPCVTYCGPDGAGHFVKMVHNGIEYGDMQLIAEAYHILRDALGLGSSELADIFAKWNEGVLDSYLIEITAKIFTVMDQGSGKPLVDLILDKAGQKGTGKWTSQVALDCGVAIPTIHAAIEARFLSALKQERLEASQSISGPQNVRYHGDRGEMLDAVHDALYASKICSYAQGFALIRAGSDQYQWKIDLSELSRIWKGGCIIRARFLDHIKQAYQRQPDLQNLLMDPNFCAWVVEVQPRWRRSVSEAQRLGLPVIAMAASLAYFDSYRATNLPQNLTQAQRDFFGSHRYERVDKPELGSVHTDWAGIT
ncbi:NADP-dependent phosphogluconate dehydrogenase, partial [Acidobacteria bacterium AH-259-D05]|nr:NADP-dependent phosphogluconate dehydrogenase [Acidobacteria bacterium AH-259-D05]